MVYSRLDSSRTSSGVFVPPRLQRPLSKAYRREPEARHATAKDDSMHSITSGVPLKFLSEVVVIAKIGFSPNAQKFTCRTHYTSRQKGRESVWKRPRIPKTTLFYDQRWKAIGNKRKWSAELSAATG